MKLVVIVASVLTVSGVAFAQTNSNGTFTGAPNGALNTDPGTMSSMPPAPGPLNNQQQTDWKNADRYAKGNRDQNKNFPQPLNGGNNPSGTTGQMPDTSSSLNH